MLTRRCTQRLFLLRPDSTTNNAFIYCLAVAASLFGIDVLFTMAESNHHHTIIFDRYGHVSAFLEHFHKLVARSQNALRGRWENFWASGEPTITRLLDRETVIEKVVYAATNPVKDRLVERVHHWPGANTFAAFAYGRTMTATRPRHFFRNPGPMPAKATLQVVVPPELGEASEFVREVLGRIDAVEKQIAIERKHTGTGVVGRRRILAQHWNQGPSSIEPRRTLRPRFAGGVVERVKALLMYRAFQHDYRRARKRWLAREEAVFPKGTYWLSRFANVVVEKI